MHRHVIAPTRFFSQVPNEIIRHPRLSANAVRLLTWQLSLPEDADEPLWKTAERAGIGKIAFQRAKSQLRSERYLFEWRHQNAQGRWVTVQLVTNTPLSPDEAQARAQARAHAPAAPHPAATPPAAGTPADRPATRQPRRTPEENTSHPAYAPHTTEGETLLLSLARTAPRLAMPRSKARRWAPLLAPWLELGMTPDAVRRTLLTGLERARSPLGALRWRLEHALPEPAGPPREPRVTRMRECAGTHTQPRLFAPVDDEERCADCRRATRGTAPSAHAPGPGLAAFRTARAALATSTTGH